MARTTKGTPALDFLTKSGVEHSVHSYDHDPGHASYGLEAAEKTGVSPDRVFKTLMVSSSSAQYIAIVPVALHVDLKAVAGVVGEKQVTMTDPKVAERSSGYVLGGISPFGQKKQLTTVVDQSALNFPSVYVSAGRRGVEVEVAPQILIDLLDAAVAPIAR